jgi:aminoglycoside 6'-N-acetyltransferase I
VDLCNLCSNLFSAFKRSSAVSGVEIVTLRAEMADAREQAARLLNVAFAQHWPDSWVTMEEAREEVDEMLAPERILRVALDGDEVVGWIGGIPEYHGNVWELHPLVVKPERQGQGIGRALVRDFEIQIKERGGLTIQLGSDDVDNMTSLANADLYVDTWMQIRDIQNFKGHPYSFYQKLGYTIIGVLPDANGCGKPDIYMAKRVE